MKEIISTKESPAAVGPYSQAVKHGNLLFTSGQIPLDPASGEVVDGDITVQTTRVMDNLVAILKAGGASVDSVIKTTCFLDNIADFAAFNAVYAKYFTGEAPARSCVAVDKLPKNVLLEVEAVAIVE